MDKKLPIFTVDVEDWNHALHLSKRGHYGSVEAFGWLLERLAEYGITAVLYMLGDFRDEYPRMAYQAEKQGHRIKSHGQHHYYDEEGDRSPYWNREGVPGLCGGFFFRLLPLWIIKREIERTGIFYIHPHDLDYRHPHIKNPLLNWKRHVGVKTARKKLIQLLKEVRFGKPS